MAAVPPGGKVVVVGNGAVMLLAAKRAAMEGYDTHVVASSSAPKYRDLLFSAPFEGDELKGLTLLEEITGDAEPAFDALLSSCDAVLIAVDGESALSPGLVDIVLPETSGAKRVVVMSRNLNGNGMGPFVVASKAASNKEVWACNGAAVKEYKALEDKIKSKAASLDADYVICRAGTLKGGGPGDIVEYNPASGKYGLSDKFYLEGNQDIVNWRMLFDCQTQGVKLTPGDSVAGPGFSGVFASTSPEVNPGDTGRIAMAGAMVYSLKQPRGNLDFAVSTQESRTPPSDSEWEALFMGV